VQIIKKYLPIQLIRKTEYVRSLEQVPVSFAPSPDMSGALKFPQSTRLIRACCQVLVSFTRHVWLLDRTYLVNTIFAAVKSFAGLIRQGNRVPEALPRHI
jgi:hypothetical protein